MSETPSAEKDRICDHPGLNHDEPFSYCWPCPACGICKFIGHGPLCGDCYATSVTSPAETREARP